MCVEKWNLFRNKVNHDFQYFGGLGRHDLKSFSCSRSLFSLFAYILEAQLEIK